MVKIERTPTPPKSLAIESQKAQGSYSEPDVIELLCIWDGTFDSDNLTIFSELFLIDESSISVTPRSMQSYILTSW